MANGARRRRSGGGARRSGGGSRAGGGRAGGGRRGGGGGGGRRGGGRRGGGGGSNAMPMIIAGVAVVLVIVVIAFANKPKKQKEEYVSTELTADSKVEKNDGPAKPTRTPCPELPSDIMDMAKQIVEEMVPKKEKADALYDEAMRAKNAGDRDTWTEKLKEAETLYNDIKYRWNEEIIGEISGLDLANDDWDEEQIANERLGRESEKVSKALERLAYIKKQLGAN